MEKEASDALCKVQSWGMLQYSRASCTLSSLTDMQALNSQQCRRSQNNAVGTCSFASCASLNSSAAAERLRFFSPAPPLACMGCGSKNGQADEPSHHNSEKA